MNRIKKITAGAVTAGVLGTGAALVPAAAHADYGTPGCVTPHEFREVYLGQTWSDITWATGSRGTVTSQGHRYMDRRYQTCNPYRHGHAEYDFKWNNHRHAWVLVYGHVWWTY